MTTYLGRDNTDTHCSGNREELKYIISFRNAFKIFPKAKHSSKASVALFVYVCLLFIASFRRI